MRGIILAGGKGTRLYPITKAVSKQILPIYDKPMIYYPLSILMMAGIRDILIISTSRDIKVFEELLLDGSQLGIKINYEVQDRPKGIAEAFIIGEKFIGNDNVALILGDNIFYGNKLNQTIIKAKENIHGATIFAYGVNNPKDFGIVEFDNDFNVISIEEKPNEPKSKYAVPGLYFYDNDVVNIAKNIRPSERGELEITTVNEEYLKRKKLKVLIFNNDVMWLDTGTYKNLLKASNFVEDIQSSVGIYIGCIEEIAFRNNYITNEELINIAIATAYGEYKNYLLKCAGVNLDGKVPIHKD